MRKFYSSTGLFTPREWKTGKRRKFKAANVTIVSGEPDYHGYVPVGKLKGEVRIAGKLYGVYAASCGLKCACDAIIRLRPA